MTMASSTFAQNAGDVITNSIGMKLVLIPAGEFLMGAREDRSATLTYFPYCDPKWLDGVLPRHKVRITKPYYMGQHEVTLQQFLQFYHGAKYKTEMERDGKPSLGYDARRNVVKMVNVRPWDPVAWKIELDHPAIYMTWNDATAFCEWLSKKEGKKYRLPTEAEWEYACRAGSESRYHFGDDPEELARFANAADQDTKAVFKNAAIATWDKTGKKTGKTIPFPFVSGHDGYAWTAPVGKFQPNKFGLYDMHGNVLEWCSDWYGENYYQNSPADDPQGPADGTSRVLRGGGFVGPPVLLQSAIRFLEAPTARYCNSGFRVVCEL